MKRLSSFLLSSGIIFVCIGCIIGVKHYTTNRDIVIEYQKALDESIVIDNDVVRESIDEPIETLSEHQQVEEVTSYENVLEIPQLDIKAKISETVSNTALARGVGHHISTVDVGENGNCVLAGHASQTYDCILNDLNDIKVYDTFFAYDKDGDKHQYYVVNKYICLPRETGILEQKDEGYSQITLYTCSDKGTKRLVVVGREYTEEQLDEYIRGLNHGLKGSMMSINESIVVEPLYDEINISF